MKIIVIGGTGLLGSKIGANQSNQETQVSIRPVKRFVP